MIEKLKNTEAHRICVIDNLCKDRKLSADQCPDNFVTFTVDFSHQCLFIFLTNPLFVIIWIIQILCLSFSIFSNHMSVFYTQCTYFKEIMTKKSIQNPIPENANL